MRSRPQQPLLQILAESVVNGERDNEGRNPGCNSGNGDPGDDPNERLPPLGSQISGCNEEFEAHETFSQTGL
jgi:hypothetical protein